MIFPIPPSESSLSSTAQATEGKERNTTNEVKTNGFNQMQIIDNIQLQDFFKKWTFNTQVNFETLGKNI